MFDLFTAEAILSQRVERLKAERAKVADVALVRRMRERKAGPKPRA